MSFSTPLSPECALGNCSPKFYNPKDNGVSSYVVAGYTFTVLALIVEALVLPNIHSLSMISCGAIGTGTALVGFGGTHWVSKVSGYLSNAQVL